MTIVTMIYKLTILLLFVFRTSFAERALHQVFVETGSDVSAEPRLFEDKFNDSIECIRRQLILGNEETGLPSFAPLIINRTVHLKFDNVLVWSDVKVDELVVDGLMGFNTVSLNLGSNLQLSASYHFGKIHATGTYAGKMNLLGLINIYGDGKFDIQVSNFDVETLTQYQMSPPLLGNYSFRLDVDRVKIRITGLMGDVSISYRYSIIASRVVTLVIKMFDKQISYVVSPYIKEFYNSLIGHLPFLDFLEKVTNLKCPV